MVHPTRYERSGHLSSFYKTKMFDVPENVWKLISKDPFPKLHKFSLEILCLFGSTYVCEKVFSAVKLIKSRTRNRMENASLESSLRLCLTELPVDIDKLVLGKQCQSSFLFIKLLLI